MDARAIEALASRQFGPHAGQFIAKNRDRVALERSKKTHKIRYVFLDGELMLVLRPDDGNFSLALAGARILNDLEQDQLVNGILVPDDVAEFIAQGKNVFAKHVVQPVPAMRPSQEVYIVNEERQVVAVGKTVLSSRDMAAFKRGIAVKVRHGIAYQNEEIFPDT